MTIKNNVLPCEEKKEHPNYISSHAELVSNFLMTEKSTRASGTLFDIQWIMGPRLNSSPLKYQAKLVLHNSNKCDKFVVLYY